MSTSEYPRFRFRKDNPFDLEPGEKALALQAHPDDELFMAAALQALLKRGFEVSVVAATDGERSTRGDRDFVGAGRRRGELASSLALIGVPENRQHYLGLPDGELHQPEVRKRMSGRFSEIIVALGVSAVLTPGAHGVDGHSDHRAVHEAGLTAVWTQRTNGHTVSAWALNHFGGKIEYIGVDSSLKQEIITAHRSQFSGSPEDTALLAPYRPLLESHETYGKIA